MSGDCAVSLGQQAKRMVNNGEDVSAGCSTTRLRFASNKAVNLFPKDLEAEHAKLSDSFTTM